MGGNTSKQKIINQMLNEVSVEVMNRNSSSAASSIEQENSLVFSNIKDSKISGISQVSSVKINVSALQTSAAKGDLQSDLTAALTNKVMQEAPALGIANKTEQEVQNIVKNKIGAKITNENLQNIAASVKQKNSIVFANVDSTTARDITQQNEAEAIMTLTNEANSAIATALTTDSAVSNDATQKSADLFGGFGIIFIIIAVVIGGGFLFMQNTASKVLQPKNLMLIGGAVAIVIVLMLLLSE